MRAIETGSRAMLADLMARSEAKRFRRAVSTVYPNADAQRAFTAGATQSVV